MNNIAEMVDAPVAGAVVFVSSCCPCRSQHQQKLTPNSDKDEVDFGAIR